MKPQPSFSASDDADAVGKTGSFLVESWQDEDYKW